jgi:ankyrin repeat protein
MSLSYILSWGAAVNLQDVNGLTPLHLAVKTSEDMMSTRTIRALLLKGADPSIRDYRGLTPLDYL